ncbi:MAG: hypothetical protein LBM27_02065 [Lactobacillaceae bacterium]|jgi:hypothetical protein|nr:hypothetical protein [Lactobacillaceae bacterium]
MAQNQEQILNNFKQQKRNGKLSQAYLFIDAKNDQQALIKKIVDILSDNQDTSEDYYNVFNLEVEEGKKIISVDQVRNLMEEFQNKTKVVKIAIIHEAEKLNPSSSNALLKFIETPDENQIIIFIAKSESSVLSTIRSRTQIVVLPSTSKEELQASLVNDGVSVEEAELLSKVVSDLDAAKELQVDGWFFNLKNALTHFSNLLSSKSYSAFYEVEKSLVPLFDNTRAYVINQVFVEILKDNLIVNTPILDITLRELKKINFNVPLQVIYESIALKGASHD